MDLTIFIVFVVVYSITSFLIKIREIYKKLHFLASQFPGPKGLPLLGMVPYFLGPLSEFVKTIDVWTRTFESPYAVNFGPLYFVVLTKYKDVECLLKSPAAFEKSAVYSFFNMFIKEGLLTTNNEILFNIKISTEEAKELAHYMELPKESASHFTNLIFMNNKLSFLSWKTQKIRQTLKKYHSFIKKNISRLQEQTFDNQNDKPYVKILRDYAKDESLSEEYILSEITTTIAAGIDTITATCTFTLLAVGAHKEIQDKIMDEMNDIFEDENRPVSFQDLQKMTYLECVIKEILRMLPVVAFIGRRSSENIKLDKGIAPKGSDIAIDLLQLHRDPKVWKDPLVFNPDRFSEEEFSKIPAYAFRPWSGGTRGCPGKQFSLFMTKMVISTFLRRFEVFSSYKSAIDIEIDRIIVSEALHGHNVTLKKRGDIKS